MKCIEQTSMRRILSACTELLGPRVLDRMRKERVELFQLNVKKSFALETHNYDALFRVNGKCVYVTEEKETKIYNRWTRRSVKRLKGLKKNPWSYVMDVQLNERLIAVQAQHQSGSCSIEIYDLENLNHIQTVASEYFSYFCLGSNVLITCERSVQDDQSLIMRVYRWNPFSVQFVDMETQRLLAGRYPCSRIYVDRKYLIVDLRTNNDRLIQVFNLETLQQVRERRFTWNHHIRREYSDGGIVVETQDCIALWDVDKDIVEPIADHPSDFYYSFAMSYHPYQIVIDHNTKNQLGFLKRPSSNSSTNSTLVPPIPPKMTIPCEVDGCPSDVRGGHFCYFDGVQLVYRAEKVKSSSKTLHIVDMVG